MGVGELGDYTGVGTIYIGTYFKSQNFLDTCYGYPKKLFYEHNFKVICYMNSINFYYYDFIRSLHF